ncbi:hypothetical protein H5410_036345 [Solanum commersonii]|uniref:Transposase-associated domain-containing protein n=1 Tax=Solanum commersonii TaxID=4109 RepID=A0A9J5Y3X8_SOLCO|nr:hypothetical protein H5410_036345 [Solanum commersonii]
MDHRLWMYNMHYETVVGLKPEFIDGVRDFIENTMTLDIFMNNGLVRCPCNGWLNRIGLNMIGLNMIGFMKMINDAFRVQGGMKPEQYFDKAPNEEAIRFYDQLEESSRPLCEGSPHSALKIGSSKQTIKQRGGIEGSVVQGHIGRETGDFYSYYFGDDVSCRRNKPNLNDEINIVLLFPPISIFNQNGGGSKKRGKRGFTNMEMQSAVTHFLPNFPEIQPYVNDVSIVQQQVDVELETTLQHPQHILEEVSDDEILNVEEQISENEENESFDDEEWDNNENETTEEEK